MSLGRFALHLGFPTPDRPLFAELVGSVDPLAHIAFALDNGFGGIADPFGAMRPPAVQAEIGRTAMAAKLAVGSFLYLPFDEIGRARWASDDAAAQTRIMEDVEEAIAIAERLGSRSVAVLSLAEPDRTVQQQGQAMADLLRRAGDLAAPAGIVLAIEGVNPARLPQMLLHGTDAAAAVVRAADHPAVRLCFDTGHAAACGEPVVETLRRHADLVAAVQLADHPGRVEIGAGVLHVSDLLRAVDESWGGLLELEHGWSEATVDCQSAYLDQLRTSYY